MCVSMTERYILDVSEPFPSRFQLSSSNLLLTEHSGWERPQTSTHNHLLHFKGTIFIILRVLTIFARTHRYTHLQSRATQNPSCCQKIPALPKSIVGNFCYCLSLAISRFLSVFLPVYLSLLVFFMSVESLLRLQECVCWSKDEGWSVHRCVTGKITADKWVLMKDAGPSPAVFGVECCQGLWGGSLWVLSPCWKVKTAGRSISRWNACAKKWNFVACVDVD